MMEDSSMKFIPKSYLAVIAGVILSSSTAYGRIYFSPFVSVSSNKNIDASKVGQTSSSSSETAVTSQRTTYGLKAGLSFWRIFRFQTSIGRSQLEKTVKTQYAVDDFEQIDFEQDLNMSTSDPDADVTTKEVMDKLRVSVVVDPGFWIFLMRAKMGVQASRRSISLSQNGVTTETLPPITYNPIAGAGLGVKLGRTMKAMIEYDFNFYKYPELKPLEREVSISYTIALGR
jgi:hypothetical protein